MKVTLNHAPQPPDDDPGESGRRANPSGSGLWAAILVALDSWGKNSKADRNPDRAGRPWVAASSLRLPQVRGY